MPADHSRPPRKALGVVGTTLLGAYMIVLSILLAYLLVRLWPSAEPDTSGRLPDATIRLAGDAIKFTVSAEEQFILLAMVSAALGSYVHAATSFSSYVGNRQAYVSWVWWYILRVFVGMSLAVIFYFVIRAGFFSTGTATGDISPFGIAAVSGLVGMFSKQAADKLKELFDTLFRLDKPDGRTEKLSNPVPVVSSLEPSSVPAGDEGFSLKVNGDEFVMESVVRFNGEARPTTFENASQLTVRAPASDRASPREIQVEVFNPPPGGGTAPGPTLRIE